MKTIPTIPEYHALNKTPFADFLAEHGARTVTMIDGGMYGNLDVYLEVGGELFTCHAYQSSGFSPSFSAHTDKLDRANWGEGRLPRSFQAWIEERVESASRAIDEERKYIGRVVCEYVAKHGSLESFTDEIGRNSLAHIESRSRGMERLRAKYRELLDEQRALEKAIREGVAA